MTHLVSLPGQPANVAWPTESWLHAELETRDPGAFARHADAVFSLTAAQGVTYALLIVQRGYYAIGDRITPLKIGLRIVLVDLVLNLTLVFWIGGRGMALSTSLCGILQFGWCLLLIQDRIGRMPWRSLVSSAGRAIAASAGMSLVASWTLQWLSPRAVNSSGRLLQLGATVLAAVVTYALLAWLLRLNEFWMLLRPHRNREDFPR